MSLEASPKDDDEPVPDDGRHRHRGGHRLGRGDEALLPKGHDPRDFALFAFGGAGPLHAVEIVRELGIPTVLMPRFPGITSVGMLGDIIADLRATSPRNSTRVRTRAKIFTRSSEIVVSVEHSRGLSP